MAHFTLEEKILPDDEPPLPEVGSERYEKMIAAEERIKSSFEAYERMLDHVADVPFAEILDAGIDAAVELLSLTKPEGKWSVLDLGAGTGLAAARLVRRSERVGEVTLHDPSSALCERARAYLAKHFPALPTHTWTADLTTTSVTDRFPNGAFDAVLTMNHMQHYPREKQSNIFQAVGRVLSEGGVFLDLAHVKPLTADWKQRMIEQVLGWMPASITEAQRDVARDHVQNEHVHVTLPLVFDWLERAGFRFYDCPYRRHMYAMVVAVK